MLNEVDASIVNCMLGLKYLRLCRTQFQSYRFVNAFGKTFNISTLLDAMPIFMEVGELPATLIELELSECCRLRKIGLSGLEKLEKFQLVACHTIEEHAGLKTLVCLKELKVNCHYLKRSTLGQFTELQVLTFGSRTFDIVEEA